MAELQRQLSRSEERVDMLLEEVSLLLILVLHIVPLLWRSADLNSEHTSVRYFFLEA